MTTECKDCKKRFKTLTKEGICACCFFERHKEWSKEYSEQGKKVK